MPSMFNARDAANYERLMGRWSRRSGAALYRPCRHRRWLRGARGRLRHRQSDLRLADAADIEKPDRGRPFGNLTCRGAERRTATRRIRIEQGDGRPLRFADASFDRDGVDAGTAFGPAATRGGGGGDAPLRPSGRRRGRRVLGLPGGSPCQRVAWDTAAALDEAAVGGARRTMPRPIYAARRAAAHLGRGRGSTRSTSNH